MAKKTQKQTGRLGDTPFDVDSTVELEAGVEYMASGSATVRIKRFDKELPLPEYQTEGALAVDLYARVATTIPPRGSRVIPSNIAIELPPGLAALVTPRSSLPLKTSLILGNSPGLVDTDYCGDEDEIGIIVTNLSGSYVKVERGQRLANLLFVPVVRAIFEEVDSLGNPNRGGYGTTGQTVETITVGKLDVYGDGTLVANDDSSEDKPTE